MNGAPITEPRGDRTVTAADFDWDEHDIEPDERDDDEDGRPDEFRAIGW